MEGMEKKENDSCVTTMLIETTLSPPLVLEEERTVLEVMDKEDGECCFIGLR